LKRLFSRLLVTGAGLVLSGLAPLVAAAALELSGAWVRALPPGQPSTAAYLTVGNPGTQSINIVGASAAIAETTQIHSSREVDGMLRMEQLLQIEIPPGQSIVFAPGGTHLMLLGLKQMPAPGDTVQLCLQPAGAPELCTSAEVRKGAGDGQSHAQHQH
jgi:copper(I)-binding protein